MPYCKDLGLLGAALVALLLGPLLALLLCRRRRFAVAWRQVVMCLALLAAEEATRAEEEAVLAYCPIMAATTAILELSEKYQKCFDPLQYFVAGFLKFLCLPKYHFELEYLPTTKDAANSEGKVLEDQEKIDMSDLYLCANLEEKRVVKKGRFLCIHSCRTVQSLSSQVVAPKAEHVDDSLDLLLVNGSGRMRLLRLFMCLQFGWHLSLPYVEYVRVLYCRFFFCESSLNYVSIQWNIETVINILQFTHGSSLGITSSNFIPLLEGALFFGVETLLLECETWFCKITSERGLSSRQISLGTIIEIWNFSLEHGQFDSDSFTVHVFGYMELVNLNLWHVFIKKIILSGCAHITEAFLFLAVLPSDLDATLRKTILSAFTGLDHHTADHYRNLMKSIKMLSFEAVHEIDISKCSKVHSSAAVIWLHLALPSLRTLKASHCLQFKLEDLYCLIQKCPLIAEVDLTVDVSSVIPTKVSVLSASAERYQLSDCRPCKMLEKILLPNSENLTLRNPVLSNISKLTLEGRNDLNDLDLLKISALSDSLSYLNIKGCTLVTDAGISKLLCKCFKILSLILSYTSFGINSILTLCSGRVLPDGFPEIHHNHKYSNTMAFRLQQLDIGGCKGVDQISMLQLMNCTYMLKCLSLRETSLVDDVLYNFMGSSLESIDVSETMVSMQALTSVIRQNPGVRILKATGCRNLHQPKCDDWMLTGGASFEDLLCELNSQGIICSGWPGLTYIHLEDCGKITSNGVSFLFNCKAVEDLLLRHNGRGIGRNFICDAALELPVLRKVALDLCDACEGGFVSPNHTERYSVGSVKISRCKTQRCAFELQTVKTFKPVHKETIVLEWNSTELRTTMVKERL
ncbi:hypothetical protein COCNU_15G000040 [Cocos nucifera]|uniref:Uncharacterized protein n=1 Tax=Cocos nucifera TaxID=13894 RepID=A0A8K0NDQ4_COCNU|nr:hypothetical protein COCNU_15G000040 [Cocos nucifera]